MPPINIQEDTILLVGNTCDAEYITPVRNFSLLVQKSYNPDLEKRSDFHINERIRMLLYYIQNLYNNKSIDKSFQLMQIMVVFTEISQYMNVNLEDLMQKYITIHKEAEEHANQFSDNSEG